MKKIRMNNDDANIFHVSRSNATQFKLMFCTKNQVLLHRRRLSWPFRIHQNLRNCPTKLIFVFFMFVIVILMNIINIIVIIISILFIVSL